MMDNSIKKIFKLDSQILKPRKLNQTWIKDIGYDQAPHYSEKMGLYELEDFLTVTSERIDHVKITTTQILNCPEIWLKKKIAVYKKYKVQPYLDHTYFMKAFEIGAVDKAIVLGKELGFEYIEFMSTYKDVPEEDLFRWRKLSKELGLNMFYEHHPKRNWFKSSDEESSAFADIISMAKPFIDDGAIMLVLDHEEFELQNNEGKVNYKEIIDYFGKEKICFEITSPKEGNERWLHDLKKYFQLFGSNINVCNVMPSQALLIENLRKNPDLDIIPKRF